jgi:transposase-like protein
MATGKRRRLGADTWRGILERFAGGGMAVDAFCEQEGVSPQTFYRWRARLGKEAVVATPAVRAPAGFVDLGALAGDALASSRLELKLDLGGGVVLQLIRG